MIKGLYGEVFLSIPCVLNKSGVAAILDIKLNNENQEIEICKSTYLLDEIQKLVNY
jgi:malate/lactate dehydrogenase